MSFPADPKMRLFADWAELHAYMASQSNLRDPDERMRLARWCQMNGRTQEAVAEAKAALALRPGHTATKQLLAILERALATAPSAPAAPAVSEPITPPVVDLSADAMNAFMTRIQPILMNACASCHATGRGGDFQLLRCHDATLNRRATQVNLAAVLKQIHWEQPAHSPALVKALSAHGSATQAPFAGRHAKPFQYLHEWVQSVVTTNPHLRKDFGVATAPLGKRETPALAPATNPTMQSKPVAYEVDRPAAPVSLPLVKPLAPMVVSTPQQAPATPARPAAVAPTQPADEYDVLIFNRQMHPAR
jgi:hypothetical protein